MKTIPLVLFAIALTAFSGCRREDIREFTVDIPGLTPENTNKVVQAFWLADPYNPRGGRYREGIDIETFRFDLEKKKLTMKYDSMKTAHTNIRMLIQDAGIEVFFPSNTTGRAGY